MSRTYKDQSWEMKRKKITRVDAKERNKNCVHCNAQVGSHSVQLQSVVFDADRMNDAEKFIEEATKKLSKKRGTSENIEVSVKKENKYGYFSPVGSFQERDNSVIFANSAGSYGMFVQRKGRIAYGRSFTNCMLSIAYKNGARFIGSVTDERPKFSNEEVSKKGFFTQNKTYRLDDHLNYEVIKKSKKSNEYLIVTFTVEYETKRSDGSWCVCTEDFNKLARERCRCSYCVGGKETKNISRRKIRDMNIEEKKKYNSNHDVE